MNAFHVIQRQFQILEIRPQQNQQQQQKFTLNGKNKAILLSILIHIMMVFAYLAIGASNYDEYAGSLFICLTALTGIFFYLSFTWQSKSIFDFMDDLNDFVLKRKNYLT